MAPKQFNNGMSVLSRSPSIKKGHSSPVTHLGTHCSPPPTCHPPPPTTHPAQPIMFVKEVSRQPQMSTHHHHTIAILGAMPVNNTIMSTTNCLANNNKDNNVTEGQSMNKTKTGIIHNNTNNNASKYNLE